MAASPEVLLGISCQCIIVARRHRGNRCRADTTRHRYRAIIGKEQQPAGNIADEATGNISM